jgi:hypothetical protein
VFFNVIGGSRKGEKIWEMTKQVGSQKRKEQMQMWTEYTSWSVQIEEGYGTLSEGKDLNSGPTSGLSTMTMHLYMMH